MLTTVRSRDQFNTTIYSNDDRYRGLRGCGRSSSGDEEDMRERGLGDFDLVDATSFSRVGTTRSAAPAVAG